MKEMQKTQFLSLGRGDPLEEEMTTHSIILAWKVLWMEEPVGYSPWGRKEPDTHTHTHINTHTHTHTHTYTWATREVQYNKADLRGGCAHVFNSGLVMTANMIRASSLDHQLSLWYGDSLSPFIYSISRMNYVLNAQICVVLRASLILDWPKCLRCLYYLMEKPEGQFWPAQ